MLISLEELRNILKQSKIPYYRDNAPNNAKYPYLIYEYVQDLNVHAGNQIVRELQEYQLSYITVGVESELDPFKKLLHDNKVIFSPFNGVPYDENDLTITQFVSYVRCKNEKWV